jgi:hypothetical protein
MPSLALITALASIAALASPTVWTCAAAQDICPGDLASHVNQVSGTAVLALCVCVWLLNACIRL